MWPVQRYKASDRSLIQLLEVQNILGSFGTGIYLEPNGRKFWVCRMKLVKH